MIGQRNLGIYFVISFVLLVAIDFIWLGLIAKNFYLRHFGDLVVVNEGQLQVNYLAAFTVYILLALALSIFVLPQTAQSSALGVWGSGFLLGFIVYGVYDMTNMATLKQWPLILATVDMLWGSVLCGTVALLTQIIRSKF